MTVARFSTVLVILLLAKPLLPQNINDNSIDQDDINPLAEAAAEILKAQNLQNIGGMVSSFLQSGGAKHLGDALASATKGQNAGQLLQGLSALLGQGQGQGFDPSILGAVASMMSAPSVQKRNAKAEEPSGFDPSLLLSLLGNFLGETGNGQNFMDYLPIILQSLNSFIGPEADHRAKEHSNHAWLLPPILERIHVLFDHFVHSELGKRLISRLGAEKFVKIFADENGRLSYSKFVEMMENHSFRRHWIRMVTDRIATFLSYVSDPKVHKKYVLSVQNFVNSILKSQGYPKSTLFDPKRPVETITALVNYFAKKSLGMKINAKQYVKPAVEYVQHLLAMAQQKGVMGTSADSRQMSDVLADTINLEIIEPVARVNRAYRFATRIPKCDKYVMCLVNQPTTERESLPGLRLLLSKSSSLILSWFLSSQTGTSFWTLYTVISDSNNCKVHYLEACNDFHAEEMKVTTEYVHNEL